MQLHAAPLEAALLQHVARGRIGDAGAGLHRLVAQVLERVIDQRVQRLLAELLPDGR